MARIRLNREFDNYYKYKSNQYMQIREANSPTDLHMVLKMRIGMMFYISLL